MTPLFATSIYWHLPVLLVVFSLVYSATRHDRWDYILLESLGWAYRIASFLGMIGVALYVLSTYPDYWPYLAAAIAVIVFLSYFGPSLWMKKSQPAKT